MKYKNMTFYEVDLYQRISDFKLDLLNANFSFSAKLSWEYRWTEIFAYRAIQEYKKFIFIAMVVDHDVSPSTIVDRVWHLHLLYTHSYWSEFCGKVLKRPFHHTPSLGSKEEGLKYRYQYQQTLQSYRIYFGLPPSDIWNNPKLKGEPIVYQWINRHQYWIIPKISTSFKNMINKY